MEVGADVMRGLRGEVRKRGGQGLGEPKGRVEGRGHGEFVVYGRSVGHLVTALGFL